jgi:hypothetical protein
MVMSLMVEGSTVSGFRSRITRSARLPTSSEPLVRDLAAELELPYQRLINLYLRDCAAAGWRLSMSWRPVRSGAVQRALQQSGEFGLLAEIWPPLLPRDRPVACREQAEGLGVLAHERRDRSFNEGGLTMRRAYGVIADRSGAAASIFHGS